MTEPDIFCIIGPTAIGKSNYAYNLAQKLNTSIISADAYQIYKFMDIGTAKPSKEMLSNITHYLINEKNPNDPYSLEEFLTKTKKQITINRKNNRPTIICG